MVSLSVTKKLCGPTSRCKQQRDGRQEKADPASPEGNIKVNSGKPISHPRIEQGA